MQVVLMHDRMDLTPDILEALRSDILEVLSRYMEIDPGSVHVDLEQGKGYTALVSNVKIKRVIGVRLLASTSTRRWQRGRPALSCRNLTSTRDGI